MRLHLDNKFIFATTIIPIGLDTTQARRLVRRSFPPISTTQQFIPEYRQVKILSALLGGVKYRDRFTASADQVRSSYLFIRKNATRRSSCISIPASRNQLACQSNPFDDGRGTGRMSGLCICGMWALLRSSLLRHLVTGRCSASKLGTYMQELYRTHAHCSMPCFH